MENNSTSQIIPVKLFVDGFDKDGREALVLSYKFTQTYDSSSCKTTGKPCGGTINLTLKALNEVHNGQDEILNWMLTNDMLKDGKIELRKTTDGQLFREIVFTKGSCVEYTLNWEESKPDKDGKAGSPTHSEKIVIACKTIEINNVPKLVNLWEGEYDSEDAKMLMENYNKEVKIEWDLTNPGSLAGKL